MIRRALLVAAAAVALILAPSVAMAYNAPGFSSSVSDPTPAIGQPVTVTLRGGAANAGQVIKLVITPKASPRKPDNKSNHSAMTLLNRANAKGVVKFTFKLSAAGAYKVELFNKAGALLSDQTLTVHRGGAHGNGDGDRDGRDNGHGDKSAASAASRLSIAGLHGIGLAASGGALVLPGVGAMLVARRRRSAKAPD
jgi:hypothetical protein